MHILNPMLCYNSIDIIPYSINFYKKQDIDVFVLDNYSNDGSWEYLNDNKIPCKRVNTNETFDLRILVKEKEDIIRKIKPDWVIKAGADSFIITDKPIIDVVKETEKMGFNIICFPFIRLFNTGEKRLDPDPRKVFFRYKLIKTCQTIHNLSDFAGYLADHINMRNRKRKIINEFCVLDYGNARPKEKREEEYERRKKAWKKGMNRNWGNHYRIFSKGGWLWNKDDFEDIKYSNYWKTIKKCFILD